MTDRHRILIATDDYPPRLTGAGRVTELLAKELVQRGHVVTVAATWQQGVAERALDAGLVVHRLRDLTSRTPASSDPYQRVPPPFPDPELAWRLRGLVRRFRPDLVHAYGWIVYSSAVALLGLRIPLLVSARDYANVCPKRTLVRNGDICSGPGLTKCLACAPELYGVPKATVATLGVIGGTPLLRRVVRGMHYNSTYTRSRVAGHLLPRDPVRRPGGVPEAVIPSFRAPPAADGAQEDFLDSLPSEPFILFVGALRTVKGVPDLLEAYERLENPPPLVLIGTREIDTPAIFPEGVIVRYDVPNATVLATWDHALFGVFPSRWAEPFGNVLHEAMSRGRAVIGTTPGGHEDIVTDGVDGLLVPAGNLDALTSAIRLLLDDSERREAMGRAARISASGRFSATTAVGRFEDLYDEVVDAQSGDSAGMSRRFLTKRRRLLK